MSAMCVADSQHPLFCLRAAFPRHNLVRKPRSQLVQRIELTEASRAVERRLECSAHFLASWESTCKLSLTPRG
jgi:hypothetical protein